MQLLCFHSQPAAAQPARSAPGPAQAQAPRWVPPSTPQLRFRHPLGAAQPAQPARRPAPAQAPLRAPAVRPRRPWTQRMWRAGRPPAVALLAAPRRRPQPRPQPLRARQLQAEQQRRASASRARRSGSNWTLARLPTRRPRCPPLCRLRLLRSCAPPPRARLPARRLLLAPPAPPPRSAPARPAQPPRPRHPPPQSALSGAPRAARRQPADWPRCAAERARRLAPPRRARRCARPALRTLQAGARPGQQGAPAGRLLAKSPAARRAPRLARPGVQPRARLTPSPAAQAAPRPSPLRPAAPAGRRRGPAGRAAPGAMQSAAPAARLRCRGARPQPHARSAGAARPCARACGAGLGWRHSAEAWRLPHVPCRSWGLLAHAGAWTLSPPDSSSLLQEAAMQPLARTRCRGGWQSCVGWNQSRSPCRHLDMLELLPVCPHY